MRRLPFTFQIARRPGNRSADVARENGIFRGELADDSCHGLRMNQAACRHPRGQGVQLLARCA